MAERALYDGDQVTLFWGGMAHRCRVYESHQRCGMCGGLTVTLARLGDVATTLHQGNGAHHDTGRAGSRSTDPAPQRHRYGEFDSRPHDQRMGIRSILNGTCEAFSPRRWRPRHP